MISARTFHSHLDEPAAIARLDELLDEWTPAPDDANDAGVTVRIQRPSPLRASMWTDADGLDFGATVSLAPTPTGTTVDVTVDTLRAQSRVLRSMSRMYRKRLLDTFFDDMEQQFAVNPPQRPGRRTEQLRTAAAASDGRARRAERAIDAPGMQDALRRRRLMVVWLLVGAVVATICVPFFMGVAQRRHDHLARMGVDTIAVVTDYTVARSTSVDFRFRIDGVEHTYEFDSPADVYEIGDEVRIRALRDGSFLEIDGETFDAIGSDPAAFSLLGALVLWSSVVFLGRRVRRHRRDLSRHRFVATPVCEYYLNGNNNQAIVAVDRQQRRLLRLAQFTIGKQVLTGWNTLVDSGRVLTAGPPDRTSIALIPPDRLLHVSRTRNPLRRWWWRRRLRTKGHGVAPR